MPSNIQSQTGAPPFFHPLNIDIQGAGNEPIKRGRALDVGTPTQNDNQLWTLAPAGSDWFTIQSNLTDLESGEPLVIDIRGAGDGPVASGTELDVWTPTGRDNQLWQFVNFTPDFSRVQSKLTDLESGGPLFIGIETSSDTPPSGTLLRVTTLDGSIQGWALSG
jgi:hypothetical protein